MAAEEARLRYTLIGQVGNADRDVSVEVATQAIAAAAELDVEELIVKPFFPENFLVDCRTQEVRARVLAVSPVPLAATSLSLRPWTRLVHADSETLYAKVKLEVTGIPAHAWKLATVRKLLAPFCWVERLDAATEDMSDMSQFTLTAWTKEPAAIPTARKLLIAERERPTHADPEMQLIFGRVTPCLRQKIVLSYNIQIHLRSIADFTPRMPLTFSSSPSVDGAAAQMATRNAPTDPGEARVDPGS
ncbi:unnamed protein product [Urochloa humidicola]